MVSGTYRLAREITTCEIARLEYKIQLMIMFTYTNLSTEEIKPKRMVHVGLPSRPQEKTKLVYQKSKV